MNGFRAAICGAFLCAGLAAPAAAQTQAEAIARLMADACVFDSATPAVDELMLSDAGFENTMHGDGTAEFAAPSGATIAYASREGFASCEMRLPGVGEAGLVPVATALAAEIAARHGGEAPEEPPLGGEGAVPPSGVIAGQDEDGFEWQFAAEDGAITRALLSMEEDGTAVLTSSTGTDEAGPSQ